MKRQFLLPLLFLACALGNAQWQSKYEQKMLIQGNDTLRYRIMYPKDFKETETYPVILFLHGAGERGNDNESQLVHGGKLFATDYLQERYPAIVIFPQCPKESYWSNVDVDRSTYPIKLTFKYDKGPTKPMQMVMDLLDSTIQQPYSDDDQIYLMGLSMGGMGSFELLSRRPDTFAAAIPICGGGDPNSVSGYAKNTPLWVFHGAQDNVVNPLQSMEMVSALLKTGVYPKFTLYDFANHGSWDPAFAEPELLPWLFSHKRQNQ
ncbi:alpha/beta fold hydrolase [Flagellimonas taeanensis]|uniref:carboxylesterase family protein n=1 Tax=Flavobacteriaceae TaxID=49546 RepID=UPI000E69632B|nr:MULTISPECIES: prolyl oligopeptidase family serine peptidase [Allomuricauda]MDC6384726.1 alpha/beta fold hydrolase [Muricauda sp. SK9]RIV53531.1 alpha/beta fold hydrolase [Allomuricauda taeanensis]